MATPAAAERYMQEHLAEWRGQPIAVYNPNNAAIDDLPVIYGFNNGGSADWWTGVLMAEDGACLGSHICSHEGYMMHDLGIIEGSRPDRHETFRAHYPSGYRMAFVPLNEVMTHIGLDAAYALNQAQAKAAQVAT